MKKLLTIILLSICIIGNTFAESWSGTGFALKDKYIITNHHVVDGARTLLVRGIKGDFTKTYNAVVVAKDAMHDMAIIRIEDSEFPGFGEIPYTLKSGISEVGEDIFVLGYPLLSSMGDEVKLTTGVISSRSGIQGDVSAYQISAPIQPGNSGGPLFDKNGDVIGIVNSKHRQADNAGYAIKSPYMRLFVQNSVGDSAIPTDRKMVGLSLVNKTKAVKPFVYIIYASTQGNVTTQTTPPNTNTAPTPTPTQPQIREHKAGNIYKIGDVIRINGEVGVVFEVVDGGKHGKVVSVRESTSRFQWSDSNEQNRLIGANNEYDGVANMVNVTQISDWRYKYPVFAWCADLGEGWYLPAKSELLIIYRHKDCINKSLSLRQYTILFESCWCSTEYNELCAWSVDMFIGESSYSYKLTNLYVRAVSAF